MEDRRGHGIRVRGASREAQLHSAIAVDTVLGVKHQISLFDLIEDAGGLTAVKDKRRAIARGPRGPPDRSRTPAFGCQIGTAE